MGNHDDRDGHLKRPSSKLREQLCKSQPYCALLLCQPKVCFHCDLNFPTNFLKAYDPWKQSSNLLLLTLPSLAEGPELAILFPNCKNWILLKLETLDIFIVSFFPTNSYVLFQEELVWLEAMNCRDYIAERKHEDCLPFQCQFLLAGIISLHVTLPFGRDKNHQSSPSTAHPPLLYDHPQSDWPQLGESVQEFASSDVTSVVVIEHFLEWIAFKKFATACHL